LVTKVRLSGLHCSESGIFVFSQGITLESCSFKSLTAWMKPLCGKSLCGYGKHSVNQIAGTKH